MEVLGLIKKNGKRSVSGIYTGNSEENFLDLMCQHLLLRRAEYAAYHAAMRKKINAVHQALNRQRKLLEQEGKILIRFGKLEPPQNFKKT